MKESKETWYVQNKWALLILFLALDFFFAVGYAALGVPNEAIPAAITAAFITLLFVRVKSATQ